MKKQNDSSGLVTKSFLKTTLRIELDTLTEEIDENARKYRDQILTKWMLSWESYKQ